MPLPESLGRYRILGELGTGGMAEILLARLGGPSGFARPVVLKRILPHLARQPSFVAMFLDEARTVARLRHRNVSQVQELVHEHGELFMVMEYLEGESTASLIKRIGRRGEMLDRALAAYLDAEACAGLHAAHELEDDQGRTLGLVHRDVSPQNLFVTYDGQVKVLDFGIAKAADRSARTETGLVKGKLAYMSPEQCRNQALDRRSDLFSLGVVLFELTTGRPLFLRPSEVETLKAIEGEPLVPPTRILPGYPPALERICLRALARTPEERYATALEMRSDLVAVARELGGPGEPDRALADLMRGLFADRIEEKRAMLAGLGEGAEPRVPTAEASSEPATRLETPRRRGPAPRPRRAPWIIAAAAAAALVATALVADGLRTRGPAPGTAPPEGPAVVVSALRAAWATPNGIRWEWEVNDPPPDHFAAYELVVGPTEADVRARGEKAEVWDARRNPELAKFLLPRTGSIEKVTGTITRGHAPSTDHYAILIATDHRGRRSSSEIVKARTTVAADEVALVPDGPCGPDCVGFPSDFQRVEEGALRGPTCYAITLCCPREPLDAARVCEGTASCYENLRVWEPPGRLDPITNGSFHTTAFLELAVATDSHIPSAWSETWLAIGEKGCGPRCLWRFRPLTLPADGRYHVFQVPLRALRNVHGQPLTHEILKAAGFRVREFNLGGHFTTGARVRVDEIKIRW